MLERSKLYPIMLFLNLILTHTPKTKISIKTGEMWQKFTRCQSVVFSEAVDTVVVILAYVMHKNSCYVFRFGYKLYNVFLRPWDI